jgi:hypothetical protein
MDIIISEETMWLEKHRPQDVSEVPPEVEDRMEFEAELIISRNDAFSQELNELILDIYRNDVKPKIQSMCLSDNVQMQVVKSFFNTSKPISIVIENEQEFSLIKRKEDILRIEQCGGTPMGSRLIYLYPGAFMERCGSLASVLFHELLHVAGLRDNVVYANTKQCYGDDAIDIPDRYIKR